jgi:hypothetical protein
MNNYTYILKPDKSFIENMFCYHHYRKIDIKLHHTLYNDESYDTNISIS